MTREESLIRKKIMLKSMLKDASFPLDQKEIINDEIAETERELEILQGAPKHNRPAFIEEIGLKQPDQTIDRPIFLSPSKIKRRKRDMSKVIRSGINDIDKYIIGFNPQELSVWSGSNGSGKSTVLSQIAIEAVNQNFKVALFSGELRDDRVLEWLNLQCAGKRFTESTQYANYFRVQDEAHDKINK
jgi:Mrp family chromosome partitioning ATPase